MAFDTKVAAHPSPRRRRLHRLVVLTALLVGTGLLLFHRYADPPDDFSTAAPARGALTEARLKLAEAYGHEKEHLEQLQRAHEALHKVLMLLDKAQLDDPGRKPEIEPLRSRIQALSDERFTQSIAPAELHRTYQELLAKLEAIIKRH